MRMVSKKLISLVLVVVLAFGTAAVAFASDFGYDINDDFTGAISEFYGFIEDGVFTIEDHDDDLDLPLTSVRDGAFAYDPDNSDLAFLADVIAIVVEPGVTEIGAGAFEGLPALESVEFKGDVVLYEGAFKNCPALTTVKFDGDAYLADYAFAGCYALSELIAPDGARFDACYGSLNDTAWYKAWTVDFITVGTTLIAYKGADEEETIPLNVTAIGASAFEGNPYLKKIILTHYIDRLGDYAFANSALEEVVFSNTGRITDIGKDVFYNTPYFDNYEGEFFIIDDTLIKYKGDDVSYVIIPNTVKAIGPYAFDGCYTYNEKDGYSFVISSISVPASATEFGENCFALVTFEDGSTYAPRLYCYAGTDSIAALENAGYLVETIATLGDLDGDGAITAVDARIALRIAVKLETAPEVVMASGDVDADGAVTAADARFILRVAVKLDDIGAAELLTMPRTDIEILMAYTSAVKNAAIQKVGYTKTVANALTKVDVNLQHKGKVTSIAGKDMVNGKWTYASDSQDAIDNLFVPTLLSTASIKNATNEIEDGKYKITIEFADYEDAYITYDTNVYYAGRPGFSRVIPVVNGQVFYNAISANKWFKLAPNSDNRTLNCVRKYALTYAQPTVKAVIDIETGKIESIALACVYKFAVDGRVNGVDISSKGFKTGDGVVERTDITAYTDFQW